MVFVRENFFYRKFFIEKNADQELIAIYIWELLDRHFEIRIINRSALIEGHDFTLQIGLLKTESRSAIISFDMA